MSRYFSSMTMIYFLHIRHFDFFFLPYIGFFMDVKM